MNGREFEKKVAEFIAGGHATPEMMEELKNDAILNTENSFTMATMPLPLIGLECILAPNGEEGTIRTMNNPTIREMLIGEGPSRLFDVEITVRYVRKDTHEEVRRAAVKVLLGEVANMLGNKVVQTLKGLEKIKGIDDVMPGKK